MPTIVSQGIPGMTGNDLRTLRQSLDLSQADFGRLVGYTGNPANRIGEMEREERDIPRRIVHMCWYIRQYGPPPWFDPDIPDGDLDAEQAITEWSVQTDE